MLFVYLLKCEIDVEMFFGLEQLEHIICRRRRRCRHSSRSTFQYEHSDDEDDDDDDGGNAYYICECVCLNKPNRFYALRY